jgi:hypothetical protein
MKNMAQSLGGPDSNSPISEISAALRELEALPDEEKANPLVRMDLAYLRKALELREAEERDRAGSQTTKR